jgi:hypothetical protein
MMGDEHGRLARKNALKEALLAQTHTHTHYTHTHTHTHTHKVIVWHVQDHTTLPLYLCLKLLRFHECAI